MSIDVLSKTKENNFLIKSSHVNFAYLKANLDINFL